jgi:hypothetical protein
MREAARAPWEADEFLDSTGNGMRVVLRASPVQQANGRQPDGHADQTRGGASRPAR